MAKLVFDIETSALPVENFDEVQQEYLFREAARLPDEAARANVNAYQNIKGRAFTTGSVETLLGALAGQ